MSNTHLELWDFANAPPTLRDGIPAIHEGGMLVFVLPGGEANVIDYLVARWTLMGASIIRREREDGSIVLAGPNLPSPAPQG